MSRVPAPKGLKAHLPCKPCQHCGRPMAWRKAWAKNWDVVRHCSERCRGEARRARRAADAA